MLLKVKVVAWLKIRFFKELRENTSTVNTVEESNSSPENLIVFDKNSVKITNYKYNIDFTKHI